MEKEPFEIQINFACQYCQEKIKVEFNEEHVSFVSCHSCNKTFTVMRPAIAEEILIDWENEALFQKIRAEETLNSNNSLLSLVIKVIELLTWRDKGNGQVEAIKEMRSWLIENEETPPVAELIQSDVNQKRIRKRKRGWGR